jgi:hypothetical protein
LKKLVKETVDLPFEVGVTYNTKLSTGERFTITRIEKDKVWGIYEDHADIGECPWRIERLVLHKKPTGIEYEVMVCPDCKKEIKL